MISKRKEQKEDTRKKLLEAAYALFTERGFEASSMRALAERAGVALGTIFVHFPDKHALVVAAFAEDVQRAAEAAWESLPPGPLLDQLCHLVRELYSFYAARPALSRVLVAQASFPGEAHREAIDSITFAFLARVAELYEAAVARGELKAEVDGQLAAFGFWADYFLGLLAGLRRERFDVEGHTTLVRRLLEQRLHGLMR